MGWFNQGRKKKENKRKQNKKQNQVIALQDSGPLTCKLDRSSCRTRQITVVTFVLQWYGDKWPVFCTLVDLTTESSLIQFIDGLLGIDPGGRGVLPYETLTGTCGPIGYGFQGVLSWTGIYFINFCLKKGIVTWPNGLNRINLDVCLSGFWRMTHIKMK